MCNWKPDHCDFTGSCRPAEEESETWSWARRYLRPTKLFPESKPKAEPKPTLRPESKPKPKLYNTCNHFAFTDGTGSTTTPGTGMCWSGTCTRVDGATAVLSGIPTGGYFNELSGGRESWYQNGENFPQTMDVTGELKVRWDGGSSAIIDGTCAGTNDYLCADWTIPEGCTMLTAKELRTFKDDPLDLEARFTAKACPHTPSSSHIQSPAVCQAQEMFPDCTDEAFEFSQFKSVTGLPLNGELATSINSFNVPWHQKWNAQYMVHLCCARQCSD